MLINGKKSTMINIIYHVDINEYKQRYGKNYSTVKNQKYGFDEMKLFGKKDIIWLIFRLL